MLAKHNYKVVYGGSTQGMMGALADGVLSSAGYITGVFPSKCNLSHETVHMGLSHLITVPDMHSRKTVMYSLADAFIILPGGFGVMDEMFETITWKVLQMHQKPIIIYNYANFFSYLLEMIQHFIKEGSVSNKDINSYDVLESREEIFTSLNNPRFNL
jgi:hypothetical protein